jgi:rare lipoprotein A
LSRPYTNGRGGRAQLASLALGLGCGATLTGVTAASAVAPTTPTPHAPEPLAAKLRVGSRDLNVLEGHAAVVAGVLLPRERGRTVELQRSGRGGWRTIAHTITSGRGRFVLRYTPRRLLSERVRVLLVGGIHGRPTHRYVGRMSSYRLAEASWYGGGGSLACGGWLTSSTEGVANRTLPCGTLVTLRYGGRWVRVPVVDRGPFVPGREFDLTEATKRALGFDGVGEVWSTR